MIAFVSPIVNFSRSDFIYHYHGSLCISNKTEAKVGTARSRRVVEAVSNSTVRRFAVIVYLFIGYLPVFLIKK